MATDLRARLAGAIAARNAAAEDVRVAEARLQRGKALARRIEAELAGFDKLDGQIEAAKAARLDQWLGIGNEGEPPAEIFERLDPDVEEAVRRRNAVRLRHDRAQATTAGRELIGARMRKALAGAQRAVREAAIAVRNADYRAELDELDRLLLRLPALFKSLAGGSMSWISGDTDTLPRPFPLPPETEGLLRAASSNPVANVLPAAYERYRRSWDAFFESLCRDAGAQFELVPEDPTMNLGQMLIASATSFEPETLKACRAAAEAGSLEHARTLVERNWPSKGEAQAILARAEAIAAGRPPAMPLGEVIARQAGIEPMPPGQGRLAAIEAEAAARRGNGSAPAP